MQGSTASQVIISVVPIVGITLGCVVVFFYLLWSHREKTMMIEKGLYMPAVFDLRTFSLLTGILLGFVGAVITLLFVVLGGLRYALLGGLIPLAMGAGLLLFFRLSKRPAGE